MFLTCAVRLPAMLFTESVRSFHVPATPFTFACPPSLPSVPPSRGSRLTSGANLTRCACHAVHSRGDVDELLHHRVDRAGGAEEFAGERPAFDLQRHALREVTLGD